MKGLDLEGDPPTVYVDGDNTKNGEGVVQPLQPEVADKLQDHTAFRTPETDVFDMWRSANGA